MENIEMSEKKNVLAVDDSTFESDVLKSDLPVLAMFSATWCGPCKLQTPVVEQLAKEFEGRVRFVKIDIEEGPTTAAKFSIRGVPTTILFKAGKPVVTKTGAVPKAQLVQAVEDLLVTT